MRGAQRRFIAPGLCIASQLGLHFLYGREFILYSGNWLGVWVAIMVAATWNRFAKHRRVILAAGLGLGIALAANNVMVMQRVYDEVESGLEAELRDFDGKLLPEAERTIQPRGSLRAHAPIRRQEAR